MLFLKITGILFAGVALWIVFDIAKDKLRSCLKRRCPLCEGRMFERIGQAHWSLYNGGGGETTFLLCKKCGLFWTDESGQTSLESCSEPFGRALKENR